MEWFGIFRKDLNEAHLDCLAFPKSLWSVQRVQWTVTSIANLPSKKKSTGLNWIHAVWLLNRLDHSTRLIVQPIDLPDRNRIKIIANSLIGFGSRRHVDVASIDDINQPRVSARSAATNFCDSNCQQPGLELIISWLRLAMGWSLVDFRWLSWLSLQ